jgi:hypothetical protein
MGKDPIPSSTTGIRPWSSASVRTSDRHPKVSDGVKDRFLCALSRHLVGEFRQAFDRSAKLVSWISINHLCTLRGRIPRSVCHGCMPPAGGLALGAWSSLRTTAGKTH